jgi:hypothetical protein
MTDKGQRTVLHIAALHRQKPSDFDYMRKYFFFQIYFCANPFPYAMCGQPSHEWSPLSTLGLNTPSNADSNISVKISRNSYFLKAENSILLGLQNALY